MQLECWRYASGTRAECGRDAGGEQMRGATELLVSAVCGRRMRMPSGIDLRILSIIIFFGANFCCVHNVRAIFVILHRKNEYLFGRGQFG